MTEPLLKLFASANLQPHLRVVSERFEGLAAALVEELPESQARARALRLLVDARSAAITAGAISFATTAVTEPSRPRETLDPFGRGSSKETP